MTILRDFSIIFSLIIKTIILFALFESRFPKKKSIIIFTLFFTPLTIINIALFVILTPQVYITLIMFFLTLPSSLILWLMSKYRDGRALFTLCMVDTIAIEFGHTTNIIDFYIPGETYIFMFVSRLIIFPLLLLWTCKKFRPVYLEIQKYTNKGWFTFAIIGVLFYVIISLFISYPTMIFERPQQQPILILIFILMPIVYFHIINTLKRQKEFHEMSEQESILKIQANNMKNRIEEIYKADEKFKIEKHNFRHKMQTIASLVDNQKYDELSSLVREYNKDITKTEVKHYCSNVIIDAVLSSYISTAENKGIEVVTSIVFPDEIPFDEAELAVVFANAIENAINACEKLPQEKQKIKIQVISSPSLMIQIVNSFDGKIEFNDNGIPTNFEAGHGFGAKYIVAFCEKHKVFYNFKVTDNTFVLQLVCS